MSNSTKGVSLFWISGVPLGPLSDYLSAECRIIPVTLSEEILRGLPAPLQFETVAACLAAQIRAHQLQGPYYVAGWSLDALMAYETAQQLTKQGCQVALIMMVEPASVSFNRASAMQKVVQRLGRELFHISRLRQMKFEEALGYLRGRLQWLGVRLRRRRWEKEHNKKASTEKTSFSLEKVLWLSAAAYTPSPSNSSVFLIRALHPSSNPSVDVAIGWKMLAPNFQSCTVPGDHTTIFQDPNAAILADCIRDAIRSAA